jgi:pimeloyl-ACP methyl ester carboxylesterase
MPRAQTLIAGVAALALAAGCAGTGPLRATPGRTGYAPVNGLRMYYEIHGEARSGVPPLVLLHGGGSTIDTSFSKLIPLLAKHRQVVAFEQQGHGRTADVDRPFSFVQSAEDAVGLLRHLGIPKADFLGYSNGGQIAIEVALRHPGVVRRLVIESAMIDREGSDPAFWNSFPNAKPDDMPKELRDAYRKTSPHPEDLPVFFLKSVRRMLDFKGWKAGEIKSIRAPVLVVVGDRDIVRPEHAVRMFRLFPDARLAVLPGTDHMKIVERADWLAPMVEAFLDGGRGT